MTDDEKTEADRARIAADAELSLRSRYGLTQEQWAAIPSQPTYGEYWRGVRKREQAR